MALNIVLAIHLVGVIVWLGGLFFLVVVLGSEFRQANDSTGQPVGPRLLIRFLPWALVSLIVVVSTGVVMMASLFGSPLHAPIAHRINMLVGIPAIALFGFTVADLRRKATASSSDGESGKAKLSRAHSLLTASLSLGAITAVISVIAQRNV